MLNKVYNFLAAISLVLFLSKSILYAEIINKIEILGNERVSKQTIMIYGDIKKDINYDSKEVNDLTKRLYSTGFFSNISVQVDNNVLKITVNENPIVNSITIVGIKAEKLRDLVFKNNKLKETVSYNDNKAKSDVQKIKNTFRDIGYYFVEIDLSVEEIENNRVNVVYDINLGEKAKIKKIFFVGDKKIKSKRLRDVITSEENRFYKFLSRNKFLNKGRIRLDERLLTNYYKNKGYYEVNVSSSTAEYIEDEGFIVTFKIDAGIRYKFKKIYIDVDEGLPKESFFELDKDLFNVVGDYYSTKKIKKILDRIDILTQQKELQFIGHRLEETLIDDEVEVKINIYEGPKVFVERINVIGNDVTNDDVIRSEMLVDEGDAFSSVLLNKSINNLKAKRIFGTVVHNVLEGSDTNLRVINVDVEEKATGLISAGAGVGTTGTTVSFAVEENNFLGRGVQLNTSAEVSEESLRGRFSINNPNYKYSGNSLTFTAESSKIDRLDKSGYESTETGFSLGTSFQQYEDVYLSPNISLYYDDIQTTTAASSALQKMDGEYTDLDFSYSVTSDKRNQRFMPTAGHMYQFSQVIPLYSDAPSITNGFNSAYYKEFTEDLIGSIKFYAKAINPIGSEDVKISERLHIPSSMLRGFEKNGIGPKDGDDHVGGNYAALLSFNAALPNLFPESTNTDIGIFLDTANLWGVDYDNSMDEKSGLRATTGINASLLTPLGPLTWTLSHVIVKQSTDRDESFRFRLGTTF